MCKYYKTLFTPYLEVKPENAIGIAYVKKKQNKKTMANQLKLSLKNDCLFLFANCDFNPLLHGSPLTFKVVSHPYLNISTYLQSSSLSPF